MITSSGNVIFKSGALDVYTTPDIYPTINLDIRNGTLRAKLRVSATGATVTASEIDYETTKTAVDLKTGTGTGDTTKFQNAFEQVLKDDLLVLNPSVTFTIV